MDLYQNNKIIDKLSPIEYTREKEIKDPSKRVHKIFISPLNSMGTLEFELSGQWEGGLRSNIQG